VNCEANVKNRGALQKKIRQNCEENDNFISFGPSFCNGPINRPVKSSVAIETLESGQSHYMIFVFIGKLTNWPNKMFPETGP
jgi:hypothetical protein